MKCRNFFLRPFYRAACWMVKKFADPESARSRRLEKDLSFVGREKKTSDVLEYMAGKTAKMLLILFWGTGICILAEVLAERGNEANTAFLLRPVFGEGTAETSLTVEIEGEQRIQEIPVSIQERQYTASEIEAFFQSAKDNMEKELLGDNRSLDEVRSSLHFPDFFAEGKVKAEWFTDPSGLLDDTGKLVGEAGEEGSLEEITVRLSCQEQEESYSFYVRVLPPVRTESENLLQKIKDAVEKADMESVSEEKLALPDSVDGKRLSWKSGREPFVPILAVLVMVTALCVSIKADEQVRREVREKKIGLMMEYPAFLYKVVALLRAGLTIRGVFERLAEQTSQKEKERGRKSYVYEEIVRCRNEIQSGVAEAQAYENFGRRCQLSEYIKTGSILSQNLKKGADGLADILEAEAVQGMEERRNLAKKLGEQAGTKLLFPMMLMLLVVMVILMVPAMMSFSMG